MTYKIINIFAGFQNAYHAAGWQLWAGRELIGVYHTRRQALDARLDAEAVR